ncbi:hypothetical protein BKA67DRAFT_576099 [Truncatella angustata]|uniref:DUF7702 domain-containing protein n=1 Tax=Truncatella angustata TaxID=152316 RepID=A0A9P8UFH7_9PEZI|nr:uncharacterized protein BKA67DRAFT_576099 [Truncatella angustata]KAH6648873.1 hypothetical protein BKA67DRAFT_576099 [Truncatella angustata]KAH8194025.1 hypothetical protein TruAng_011806 [Truncatella angustata]
MVSSHTSAAIAQTVFYTPAVPVTLYILVRNWNHGPKMAWYPLFAFALIRLVGGIIVIVLGSDPRSYDLSVVAVVLLNVGLIPLIVSTLFLVRLVFNSSLPFKKWAHTILKILRIDILIAIALLITGGSILGNPDNAAASRACGIAGYFNLFGIIIVLVGLLVYLRVHKREISSTDHVYAYWVFFSMPPLLLRAVYGILYSVTASSADTLTTIWNPLFGSATAFALMALMPEYLVLCVYMYLGFHRRRTAAGPDEARADRASDEPLTFPTPEGE